MNEAQLPLPCWERDTEGVTRSAREPLRGNQCTRVVPVGTTGAEVGAGLAEVGATGADVGLGADVGVGAAEVGEGVSVGCAPPYSG